VSDLFILAFAIVLPSLVTWIYFVWLAQAPSAVQQSAYSLGKALQFALPVVWLYLAHRKNWLDGWVFTREGLLTGIIFGAIVAGAMIALYALWLKPSGFFNEAAVTVREKIGGMAINTVWKFVLLGMFYSLMHSFLEEYYWRWFVFRQLDLLSPTWPATVAITVSSLAFMAHHVILLAQYFGWFSPATWFFSLSVAVGGAVWAWLYLSSGSLLGPWMSHLLIDAAIFVIGYDLAKEMFK
jgi:membrane protease YdiL (CAAX protease family)